MKKSIWNHLMVALFFCTGMYCGAWIFNHMNAWLGILFCVVSIVLGINYIVKQIKKSN